MPALPSNSISIDLLTTIFGRKDDELALPALPDADDLPRLLADPRFQELIEIVNLAVQIHGSGAKEWFSRPEPELGLVLPATLMRDPANGRKLVKQSLMNHLRGVYALGQDGRVLPKSRPTVERAQRLSRASRARPAKLRNRPRT
jgi:hypothetical protein